VAARELGVLALWVLERDASLCSFFERLETGLHQTGSTANQSASPRSDHPEREAAAEDRAA
jgi:hypothetical protein